MIKSLKNGRHTVLIILDEVLYLETMTFAFHHDAGTLVFFIYSTHTHKLVINVINHKCDARRCSRAFVDSCLDVGLSTANTR